MIYTESKILREPRVLTSWFDTWEADARTKHPDGEIDPLRTCCDYTNLEAVKIPPERPRGTEGVNLPLLRIYIFRHKITGQPMG